jgi:hypothetical protein
MKVVVRFHVFSLYVYLSFRLNPRRISIGKLQLTKVEKLEGLRAEIFEALRNDSYKVHAHCLNNQQLETPMQLLFFYYVVRITLPHQGFRRVALKQGEENDHAGKKSEIHLEILQ